jgi:DNA-binding NtrC family response regulator
VLQEPGPSFDVVITDMSMEDGDSGLAMLKAAVERDVFTEVIVLTAYGNVKNAVECMQRGAYDYVEKNIPDVDVFELLMLKVDRALQQRRSTMRTLDRLAHVGELVDTRRGEKQ